MGMMAIFFDMGCALFKDKSEKAKKIATILMFFLLMGLTGTLIHLTCFSKECLQLGCGRGMWE